MPYKRVTLYGDKGAGKQVAGAGQTGCRCRTDRLQVSGRQAALVVQVRQAQRPREGRPRSPG